jgi:uncharacterized membrane protein
MLLRRPALKPEIIFLMFGLIFGITFALICPMFAVPDEPSHYLKVITLSKGHIFFYKSWVFIFSYSPVPYLVPTLVVLTGKLLGLSNAIIFYLGRIANLLLYVFVIFLAIKYTPILKWVFMLLALMPMALYEAASFSSDGFNIAISLLLIAFILKLAFDDKISKINKNQIVFLFILGILLALSKEIYILLLLLVLIIPRNKFNSRKLKYTKVFIIFALSISTAVLWNLLVKGLYIPISPQINPLGQLMFILTHFMSFIWILIYTISYNSLFYLTTFVGSFVWDGTNLKAPLPFVLVLIYVIVLFFVALTDKSEVNLKLNQKFLSFGVFLFGFVSIFVLEYLTWNIVGNSLIDGVYGRYFIPIAPLLFLAVYNNRIPNFKEKNIVVPIFILIMLFISVFMIYN